MWSSVNPSETFGEPSLVQQPLEIQVNSSLNLKNKMEHQSLYGRTYRGFPSFLQFLLWSCLVSTLDHIGIPDNTWHALWPLHENLKSKTRKDETILNKKRDWTYILRLDQIQWHLHACSKSSVANRGAAPRRTATASSHFKSQAKFNGVKPEQILTPTEPDKLIETFHRFQPQFAKVFCSAMITTYWNWNHSDWAYSRTSYTLISSHKPHIRVKEIWGSQPPRSFASVIALASSSSTILADPETSLAARCSGVRP